MSSKHIEVACVRMTAKELKAYLKDHPKAQCHKYPVTVKRFCDNCGKQIAVKTDYHLMAFIHYDGETASEVHDFCSDECAKKMIEIFTEDSLSPTAKNRANSCHFMRFNVENRGMKK